MTTLPTEKVIEQLVAQNSPVTPMGKPIENLLPWLLVSPVYVAVLIFMYHFRPDLAEKMYSYFFSLELILTSLLIITSIMTVAWLSYPDSYGLLWARWLPLLTLAMLVGLKFYEALFMPTAPLNLEHYSSMLGQADCAACIGLFAAVPGYMLYATCRKTSTTHYYWMGILAALGVSAIGYLSLRLIEPTDNVQHLLVWHMLPMLLFSVGGAWLGKRHFRW